MSSSDHDQSRSHHQLSQFQFYLLHSQFLHHNHNPTFPPFPPSHDAHSAFPKLAWSQGYGLDNSMPKISDSEVAISPSTIENLPSLKIDPCISGKHHGKSKIPRHATCGTQRSNTDSSNLTAVNNCHYDSSLGLLTKKFISLIQEAKDGTLDLNKTADILEVQKRRIYDITNVLEGIGLIEKTSKNHIHWKGYDGVGPGELEDQLIRLKVEVESLYAEEWQLDDSIRKKQELLRSLEEKEHYIKYFFLTDDDILSLPCFQNQTLIAIKAPKASFIEVPDPDEDFGIQQRQYKMIVRSSTGPIDLYLLSKHNGKCADLSVKQAKLIDSSSSSIQRGMKDEGLCFKGQDEVSGIKKITSTELDIVDDYWFQSDPVILTELWSNEQWVLNC